jgi:hypothetical protein
VRWMRRLIHDRDAAPVLEGELVVNYPPTVLFVKIPVLTFRTH